MDFTQLKIHESMDIHVTDTTGDYEHAWRITRVISGFIYYCYSTKLQTFVPYTPQG